MPKVLIAGKCLERIAYSDKPLSQNGEIHELTVDEFNKRFDITYTESLWGNPAELTKYIGNKSLLDLINMQPDLPKEEAILQRLEQPLESLVLCNMGPEVGHGLFARDDIPARTVLFMYAGIIQQAKVFEEGDHYSYSWGALNNKTTEKCVSANKTGGLARFMQHLPLDVDRYKAYLKASLRKIFGSRIEERNIDLDEYINELMMEYEKSELDEIQFVDIAIRKQIAVSNVNVSQVVINDIPIQVCWTLHGINKNEQVGFCYGKQYWEGAHKTPRYFNLRGELIPLSAYTQTAFLPPIAALTLQGLRPIELYQQGVNSYKQGHYAVARDIILDAVNKFKTRSPGTENSLKIATCYSALTSCYEKLSQNELAVSYCEQALEILYQHNSEKIAEVISKHKRVLDNFSADIIYQGAVSLYNEKKYFLAAIRCTIALKKFNSQNDKVATCHSTLASCLRDMGDLDSACNHAEMALTLRTQIYKAGHPLIKKIQEKVNELHQIKSSTLRPQA